MMDNAFLALADTQLTAAAKARHRAAEKRAAKHVVNSDADAPMVPSAQEKAQQEKSVTLREWKRWRRERSDMLLEGPLSREYKALLLLVGSLAPESAPALVSYVQRCEWLKGSDLNTRHIILSVVDDAIVRLRMVHGLAPFDDSLPGEEPTAFERIRKHLTGVGAC